MPQFDIASFGSQFFWLTFVFGGLYLLVVKFIAPKAESILTARNNFLSENLSYAEDYNKTASLLKIEIETKLQETDNLTEEMKREATVSLNESYELRKEKLSTELTSKTTSALEEIKNISNSFHSKELQPCLNLASFIIEKITNKPADLDLLDKIHKKIH
jgi:F0F1-type ATP synthase membrane subunit b/b'